MTQVSQPQIQQVFAVVIDGKTMSFNSRAEAMDALRRPAITKALNALNGNNKGLTEWLIAHQEQVESAFDIGTIRRVSKSEAKALAKALDAIVESKDPRFAFVIENRAAVQDSFRWPTVKRMTDEEKASAARNTLVAASEGNEQLADWVLSNKDALLEAYEAGKPKREAPANGQTALAEWRQRQAELKAEMEAAKAQGQEAVDALLAKRAAEAEALAAAKAAAKAQTAA